MSKFKALFEKYIDLSRLWNVIIAIILAGVIFCFEGRLSTLELRNAYNKLEKYFILCDCLGFDIIITVWTMMIGE
jgi:hypothetical protein